MAARPVTFRAGNPAWQAKPCAICNGPRDPRTGGRRLVDGVPVRVCEACRAPRPEDGERALLELYGRTTFAVLALAAGALLWAALLVGGVRGYHALHPLALGAAPLGAMGLVGMVDLRSGAAAAVFISLAVLVLMGWSILTGSVAY